VPNPNVTPLAQEFVVAARVPDPARYFFHDPNLARLDDGTFLVAAPKWGRRDSDFGRSLRMIRSVDGGGTWTASRLPLVFDFAKRASPSQSLRAWQM